MTEDLSPITTTDNNLAIICSNTSIPPLQFIYFFGGGIKLWLRSHHTYHPERHSIHILHNHNRFLLYVYVDRLKMAVSG